MKLIEKQRIGSKVCKKYDAPATPCDRLLACAKVSAETKALLHATRAALDPMDLSADIEARLEKIFTIVERIEEDRHEEMERAGETHPQRAAAGVDCVPASVAIAPCASTPSTPAENLVKTTPSTGCHESWRNAHPLRCHLSLAQYAMPVFSSSGRLASPKDARMRWRGCPSGLRNDSTIWTTGVLLTVLLRKYTPGKIAEIRRTKRNLG